MVKDIEKLLKLSLTLRLVEDSKILLSSMKTVFHQVFLQIYSVYWVLPSPLLAIQLLARFYNIMLRNKYYLQQQKTHEFGTPTPLKNQRCVNSLLLSLIEVCIKVLVGNFIKNY